MVRNYFFESKYLQVILFCRMKCHLDPLAVAANITQASFCRLDEVLLTFGYLVMQYQQMQVHLSNFLTMQVFNPYLLHSGNNSTMKLHPIHSTLRSVIT